MDSLYILIPIALVFTAVAIKAFFWAVDHRQYDDLDAAANSILFDDEDDPGQPAAQDETKEDSDGGR